ncbi:OsmC family protein [Hymenobacter sp. DH14]|uniref:OsmC family protein n=1 Tax=Hymenobacter cyanobacteriorum TaxID=2926463 RepID=A0A9X1VJ72_9BACT|nr:OsmC family protein [Hymenobacter cyanobacteriorum]MCI1187985.1 OsmC family protein [Hymenobacter cyanobacteriorum]
MKNTATARYAGHLRTEATHTASGNAIQTDAPVDNHGRGEAFSPTDLVSTALGSCMMTVMGIVAERHNWDLVGSSFAVLKHMSTEPPRRIAQIDVTFTLPATLAPQERTLLERAAHTCPVGLSLHPDVRQNIVFEYK